MGQLGLFEPSIQDRFEDFHRKNPEVYAYLVKLCYELRSKGWKRYAIGALWERLRWHFQIDIERGDDFKLNDHFRSRYARKIIQDHPDLEGFFELRELRA